MLLFGTVVPSFTADRSGELGSELESEATHLLSW